MQGKEDTAWQEKKKKKKILSDYLIYKMKIKVIWLSSLQYLQTPLFSRPDPWDLQQDISHQRTLLFLQENCCGQHRSMNRQPSREAHKAENQSDLQQFCKKLPKHNLCFAFHEKGYKTGFSYIGLYSLGQSHLLSCLLKRDNETGTSDYMEKMFQLLEFLGQ